jgi:hypothetical protein
LYVLYDLNTASLGTHYEILEPTGDPCPNSTYVGANCDSFLANVSSSILAPAAMSVSTLNNGSWNYYKYQVYSTDINSVLWVSAAPSTSGGSLSDFALYVKKRCFTLYQ